mmetsp:Transcript_13629/g.34266  ORF Transcript_13629/g.34266 Transcript_13629/m.34266 type:complete len:297 (-) Transcript_13629:2185-3075(-)
MSLGKVECLAIFQVLFHLYQLFLVRINVPDKAGVGCVQALGVIIKLIERTTCRSIGFHQARIIFFQRLVVPLHALALLSQLHIFLSQIFNDLARFVNESLVLVGLTMLFGFGTKLVLKFLLVLFHFLLKLELCVFEFSLALLFSVGKFLLHLIKLICQVLFLNLSKESLLVFRSLKESTCDSLNFDCGFLPFFALSFIEFLSLLHFSYSLTSKNTTDETLNWNCRFCNLGVLFLHKTLLLGLPCSFEPESCNPSSCRSLNFHCPLVPDFTSLRLEIFQTPRFEVNPCFSDSKRHRN